MDTVVIVETAIVRRWTTVREDETRLVFSSWDAVGRHFGRAADSSTTYWFEPLRLPDDPDVEGREYCAEEIELRR